MRSKNENTIYDIKQTTIFTYVLLSSECRRSSNVLKRQFISYKMFSLEFSVKTRLQAIIIINIYCVLGYPICIKKILSYNQKRKLLKRNE